MSPEIREGSRPWAAAAVGIQVLVAAFMLAVPSLVVGRPFVFYDTEQYFLFGESIARFLLKAASGEAGALVAAAAPVAPSTGGPGDPWILGALTVMGARSPFYGVPAFLVSQAGGLWSVIAVQVLLLASLLRRTVGLAGLARPGLTFLAICAGLTALTSAPFYASLLMPDVFAAVALLCTLLILFYADRLSPWERVAWWWVLVASLNMHATHPLVVLSALTVATPALWRLGVTKRALLGRAGAVLSGVVVAVALNGAYQRAVELKLGAPPQSPPFLTARLLEDGPGRTYLRAVCPGAGYVLCAHRRKALDDSQVVLWKDDSAQGVFLPARVAERRALIAEQPRFAIGAVSYDPGGAFTAFAANSLRQFVMFGVSHEFYAPLHDLTFHHYWSRTRLGRQIPNLDKCRADFRACDHPRVWAGLDLLHRLVVVAAFLVMAFALARLLSRTSRPSGDAERLASVAVVVVVTLAANAAICGGLSLPADRYQARLIWMIPLLAALLTWPRARSLQNRVDCA